MSFFDSIKGKLAADKTSGPSDVEKQYQQDLFTKSTDQLSPEEMGWKPDHAQTTQPRKSPTPTPAIQTPPVASQADRSQDDGLVRPQRRIHFDTLQTEKTFQHPIEIPRPSMILENETRTNAEFFTFFSFVVAAFKEKHPDATIPDLNFQISPMVGKPFVCEASRSDCTITPLAIATTGPLLRKVFRVLTPRYEENPNKLGEVTDSLYFSPNRCKFIIAKALSDAALGLQTPLSAIKLLFLRWFPERYYKSRLQKECRSDTMAARSHLQIALGGLEHMTKLHHFYRLYEEDIPFDNDAVFAADRFINLLDVLEQNYQLKPEDALQMAFPPQAFIGEDPSAVLSAAYHIVESENKRQARRIELQNRAQDQV